MDGYDIQKWKLIELKAINNNLEIEIKGDTFLLQTGKKFFGAFKSIDTLYSFICGYEAGKEGLING
jgi:hypothetical protein